MTTPAGIELMNFFGGLAYLDVRKLAEHRELDTTRFENLLMKQKAVAMPYEDPITLGINAAKPILDRMSEAEKDRIELLVTCTESAFDFGKSLSTYMHDYLGLNRNCRLFELKNACYSGVAGLQMACNFILSQTSPGARALVIATDLSRFAVETETQDIEGLKGEWSFSEPSGGSGAVAMLVSEQPYVFRIDPGASGYYGYEVMDACRPMPDGDAGDADLSLLSYLDCCENAFLEYQKRVADSDYATTFGYLAFHAPFGGMVKGAHRKMMRTMVKAQPPEIEADFKRRVMPSLTYCQRVGNILGATTALSLVSTIDNADFESPQRIGCFSYGSGCCSEFFSGVATQEGQALLASFEMERQLDERYELDMEEYDMLLRGNAAVRFGTSNVILDPDLLPGVRQVLERSNRLYLKEIRDYHRIYEWAT
uniref:CalT n=1 Tax=uncultured Candidatus Entotheonella sp. TaxID=312019 RepID=A0A068PF37_9BACT|nr:CalT [uncultured Candidatus Entotheonella sp.]